LLVWLPLVMEVLSTTTAVLNRPLHASQSAGGELWLQVYGLPRKRLLEVEQLQLPSEVPFELRRHFDAKAFDDLRQTLAFAAKSAESRTWTSKALSVGGLLVLLGCIVAIHRRLLSVHFLLAIPLCSVALSLCLLRWTRFQLAEHIRSALQTEPWSGKVRVAGPHSVRPVDLVDAGYDRELNTYGRCETPMWPPPGLSLVFSEGNFTRIPAYRPPPPATPPAQVFMHTAVVPHGGDPQRAGQHSSKNSNVLFDPKSPYDWVHPLRCLGQFANAAECCP